jgi:hypothetical protein
VRGGARLHGVGVGLGTGGPYGCERGCSVASSSVWAHVSVARQEARLRAGEEAQNVRRTNIVGLCAKKSLLVYP